MPHDFLSTMRSEVFAIKGGRAERGTEQEAGAVEEKKRQRRGRAAVAAAAKHRTVGVSMAPGLQAAAAARARAVGLSFSKYVQWCVEAELAGAPLAERFRSPGVENFHNRIK